ncbi:sugar ABC transporter substrate-binding protein [Leifsonia sp. C5G2]|uniref:ABC transporter substrate-binding protein n=1 Tax=Leifsonia sp. C5G2 TaxID=2735269 RepID=UPI0015845677|nr:sugar ABC transporter substrate-binding protein [Leifsonia sp. C5G2]NUU05232.1 sugar ABC transporter substrate-binding protein [Leifsonia sp. C5G2]
MKQFRSTRKAVATLALIAASAVALAGCSGSGGSDAKAPLTMWARSDTSPFIKPLVDAYNKTHQPNVKLTLIPAGSSFTQKLGAAVASHSAPDLVSLNLVYDPYFAQAGQLLDITDRAHKLKDLDSLNKSEINLGTWDQKLYALPFTGDASALFYNKDLFTKAGLDPNKPPTTWAEIKTAAEKISALGGDTSGYYFPGSGSGWNLFTFTPFIWANGGDVLTGEGADQKATLTSAPVSEALEFYRSLWTAGTIPQSAQSDDGSQILSLFEAGKVGMLANGAFAYSELKAKFPNLNYGITPIPGKDGGKASFAGGDTLAITKDSKNPDAAWSFLSWATSKDVQEKYIAGAGVVPIREDAVPADSDANFKALVTAMAEGRTPKSTVYSQLFEDPNGPWANLIHNSVFNGDVAQEAKTAQEQWTTILKKAR